MAVTSEASLQRGVRLLGLGFLGVFGGFQAAQGLQSSLNAGLGQLNLACLYVAFSTLCLVAPPVLSFLERRMGMQVLLLMCSAAYAAMALSNILPVPATPSPLWAVPVAFNVLVGVAAPLLWTGQNTYVARCAAAAADLLQEPAEKWTTRYNSIFFSMYQISGMSGNILASVILLALGQAEWAKQVLFVTLGILCLLGAFVFLLMPSVEGAADSSHPGLLDTGRLALTDARMRLTIPLILTNGMTLASFLGDFQAEVTCRVSGPAFTGFVIATFYGVNSAASAVWGALLSRKWLSRRQVFSAASLLVLGFLLAKLLWPVPTNFRRVAGGTSWEHVPGAEVQALDVVVVFLLAAVFALGDSFWEAGPPMTLQTFYAGSSKVVPAMANCKLWQALGVALQFFMAIFLENLPHVRGAILITLTLLSWLCILVLDGCVAAVDGSDKPLENTC